MSGQAADLGKQRPAVSWESMGSGLAAGWQLRALSGDYAAALLWSVTGRASICDGSSSSCPVC
jgi:hypothetical protein